MINKDFRVNIFGDLELEELEADIYFKDEIFAIITQEEGFENLKINIYPPEHTKSWEFKFEDLDNIMKYAKNRLWEFRKI